MELLIPIPKDYHALQCSGFIRDNFREHCRQNNCSMLDITLKVQEDTDPPSIYIAMPDEMWMGHRFKDALWKTGKRILFLKGDINELQQERLLNIALSKVTHPNTLYRNVPDEIVLTEKRKWYETPTDVWVQQRLGKVTIAEAIVSLIKQGVGKIEINENSTIISLEADATKNDARLLARLMGIVRYSDHYHIYSAFANRRIVLQIPSE